MKQKLKFIWILVCMFLLIFSASTYYSGKRMAVAAEDTTPDKPYKIANVVSGVHVYWNEVEGIEKYGVWRSETGKNGTYQWLGNPETTHFTDTRVESGTTYYYKITSMDPETGKHSDKSEAIGIVYVSTPDITERYNAEEGIVLGWEAVDGARGYAIYRKSYDGTDAWARVATIADSTTLEWIDTEIKDKNGTVYRYTIRALAGSDLKTLSGCRNTGRTMVRLTSRELSSVTADYESVKCSWTTTSWATGYEIRFTDEEEEKSFTVGSYKTGTKTFTGFEAETDYTVSVRSYKTLSGVGTFYSAWSESVAVTTLAIPPVETPAKPYKIANVVNGVHVYWKAVDGVEKYGVWRSETGEDGTYQWLGNPEAVHFTDTKVESGVTYYYKITAIDPDTNVHSEKSEAVGITYVATPDITGRYNEEAGITLAWNEIEGATGYAVYRKSYDGTDAWSRVTTVEGNDTFQWTDTSVESENGMAYRYTVRALAGSNRTTLSGCRNTGRTVLRLVSPVLEKPEFMSGTSIRCSWEALSAVNGYEVRIMDEGGYDKTFSIGNAKTETKLIEALEEETIYSVQIRTYSKLDGIGTFYSDWSELQYIETPMPLPEGYEKYEDIWLVILNDDSRWGMWDLTYLEFIKMYWSIGTENDLFLEMLKEKGPRHTDPTIWFEYDGVADLEISFPDVLTEKVYALHYAPFEYNSEDLESGNYGKDTLEAYQDHGCVCSILAWTYRHFIEDILGEDDWGYCYYSSAEVNHEVLLVKTEDGRVFQADNCGVDYWWLGLEFTPDYSKYECEEVSDEAVWRFENWQEEFTTLEKVYWHTFSFVHDYDWNLKAWYRRPVWYDYEAEEFTTYFDADVPKYYKVTFRGLPGKVISMAGNAKMDGYVDLDELEFK